VRKPILVGGLGLSAALWAWSSFQDALWSAGEAGAFGLAALGTGAWWLQQRHRDRLTPVPDTSAVDGRELDRARARLETAIAQLQADVPEAEVGEFAAIARRALPDRERLHCAILGGRGSGKSRVRAELERALPELDFVEVAPEAETTATAAIAPVPQLPVPEADLVLYLVAGDLTATEWEQIEHLRAARHRVVLAFNKQDRYPPDERATILRTLRERVRGAIAAEDAIAIAAQPAPVTVRRYGADGSMREFQEQTAPEMAALVTRLREVVASDRAELTLATEWRQVEQTTARVKQTLNDVRRERALPVIQQYQWAAAATAFANPVASLDVLAAVAINGQMLVDLSEIYRQSLSLSQAQTAAGTLGKLMAQFGLVELTTQAAGSLLKGHVATYAAGGLVQGVSAAYLTRIAGLSAIAYLQTRELTDPDAERQLGQVLKAVFEQNRRSDWLRSFVPSALRYLQAPKSRQVAS